MEKARPHLHRVNSLWWVSGR